MQFLSTPRRRRASPTQAAARAYRLLGWLQAGLSHQEIAGLEGVSRARVRQLAAEAIEAREDDPILDQRRLAELRLAPALRLASRAVAEGELKGVDRLVNVIDRVLKLQPERKHIYDAQARAKLLAKINRNLERLRRESERARHENDPNSVTSL